MKIRFPRFSLMTAVVVMIAAGGLIWLSTAQPIPANSPGGHLLVYRDQDDTELLGGTERGWPWPFLFETSYEEIDGAKFNLHGNLIENPSRFLFDWKLALADLLIALAILALVGIITESIHRRVRLKK
ncbi:MAG TPA: hypothetical protein VKX17_02170 [Planctomycetota bacterium]|nr:hypothetical protein [Planctomycetota bacterium]